MPGIHHELSPSKFPAWALCPCFDSAPEERQDATEGTRQHAALSAALGGSRAALDELSTDGREAVEWAEGIIRSLAGQARIESETQVSYTAPDAFAPGGVSEVYHGTADAVMVHPPGNTADLCDYKSGADHFTHHEQMAGYALALFSMRPRLKSIRAHLLYGSIRSQYTFTFTQAEAAAVVLPILAARQSPDKQPAACDYCTLCAHRLTCPAITAPVQAVAAANNWQDMIPAIRAPEGITDPATLGKALNLARLIQTWAEAVRAKATETAKAGATIPGWKIQERRGTRDIPDIAAAIERTGLSPGQVLSACKLSLPKLADAVAAARSIPKKQAAQVIETELADLIREGNPTASLVQDKAG